MKISHFFLTFLLSMACLSSAMAATWCGYNPYYPFEISIMGEPDHDKNYSSKLNNFNTAAQACSQANVTDDLNSQLSFWRKACEDAVSDATRNNTNKSICNQGAACQSNSTNTNPVCFVVTAQSGGKYNYSCTPKYATDALPSYFDETDKVCKTCKKGQVFDSATKTCACPAPTVFMSTFGINQCIPCNTRPFFDPAKPVAYDAATKTCKPCTGATPLYNSTTTFCEACPSATVYNSTLKKCVACEAPTVFDNTLKACVPCSAPTLYNAATKSCEACPSPTVYNGTLKKCEACSDGTVFSASSKKCEACVAPTAFNSTLMACAPCSAPTVYSAATKSCEECPAPTAYNAATKSCQACASPNIYKPASKTCEACPAPLVYNNGACVACTGQTPNFNQDTLSCVTNQFKTCAKTYGKGSTANTLAFLKSEVIRLNRFITITRNSGGVVNSNIEKELNEKTPCCTSINNGVACPTR